jgi:glucose/arabinose dehydrogenase/cytochrome c553
MIRIAYLAVLPLFGALACTSLTTSGASAQPSTKRSRMNVSQYYLDTCAKCHGDKAQGGGGGTPSLISKEKFDQKYDRAFFDAIKKGVPDQGMEPYGETLSDEEVWAQVVHIRELQARGLRAKFGSPKQTAGVYRTDRASYRIETVVAEDQGLETPWAIEWLGDGRMLVANRPGRLDVVRGGAVVGQVEGIPASKEQGQGGLMDVVVRPSGWVYLAYTEAGRERGGMTKIVRGKLQWSGDSARWVSSQVIWEADQKFYTGAGVHFGSRIQFDGKGHVFFVVGERGGNMLAQELTNPFGKIFRLNEDGTEPKDNPFVGQAGAIKGIWSYGHRNPQGLTFDSEGNLWCTEHGPRGGDELNLIRRGANYGWPVVAHSINYNDTPFQTPWAPTDAKIEVPVFRWLPSIGACGLDVMKGSKFASWRGDLLAGGLAGANVDRIRVKGGKLVEREEVFHGHGRVRDVTEGPDGLIYIALNGPDKVVRLTPVAR